MIRITDPVAPVVTLADFKAHTRVTSNTEDALMQSYLDAAEAYVDGIDGVLNRALILQVWQLSAEHWPAQSILLPFPMIRTVTIEYDNAAGGISPFAGFDLLNVDEPNARGILVLTAGAMWPLDIDTTKRQPIRYDITAGNDLAADLPGSTGMLVMLLAAHWFEIRQPVIVGASLSDVSMSVEQLIEKARF